MYLAEGKDIKVKWKENKPWKIYVKHLGLFWRKVYSTYSQEECINFLHAFKNLERKLVRKKYEYEREIDEDKKNFNYLMKSYNEFDISDKESIVKKSIVKENKIPS